jgi:exodeoxyribonuclease VII large subunit
MATSYDIYELNTILRTEFNKVIKELPQIQLKGEIIEVKVFKNYTGVSFKIKEGDSEFNCKAWQRKNIDIQKIISYENTSCIITGTLVQDNFGNGYRFILDLEDDVIKDSDESKIKKLKEECESRGYFKDKKHIIWSDIKRIGLISKADTQGYTDFMVQFKIPLDITLKEIVLEGENTETTLIKAIKELQDENVDIIIIIRGGGCTSDISNSFDKISIYESIKKSTIPILTAIGHQADKDEKLLITSISDYNFPTPTSAALELNKILIQPYVNKLNNLSQKIETIFYDNLN